MPSSFKTTFGSIHINVRNNFARAKVFIIKYFKGYDRSNKIFRCCCILADRGVIVLPSASPL